jgi:fumarate reductase subunit C
MTTSELTAGSAASERARKDRRWPARLDVMQSASGLVLALFMWGHMFFVSSILLGKDAMWTITKMFEGYFLFGQPYPGIVSVVVGTVIVLLVVHAALAVRKFPINYRQFKVYREHMGLMHHEDTTLWYWQVVTGFAMFFLAAPHLFQMLTQPGLIGPFESADRVWSYRWWPFYIVLLLAVEVHGGVGLYRLAVKWGWPGGANADATRKQLKMLKWALTVFFLVLGFATLAAYIKIGVDHADKVGERYTPASVKAQGAVK